MKTYSAKPREIEQKWCLVDANGKVVGRLASEVAKILRGKNKPQFTPHVDTGDFVIVVNAAKIVMTGKKLAQKVYYHHSGYPGGIKSAKASDLIKQKPQEVIRHAIAGMLPKNSLGRKLLKKVKIYPGSEHPHKAQMPSEIRLDRLI